MPLKIVRNDITKMNTQAIVNTANEQPIVGNGCDSAVYMAAGFDKLLQYRREKIGVVEEGDVFLTPGFDLQATYIIHAVSPAYRDGEQGEEEKLRSCYKKSLNLAKEHGIGSIAFPLIATGSFGYPPEEGMRIAVDEINAFLLGNEMDVYLVVFGDKATAMGKKIFPDLEAYIDRNYVEAAQRSEYDFERPVTTNYFGTMRAASAEKFTGRKPLWKDRIFKKNTAETQAEQAINLMDSESDFSFVEEHESKLEERMRHMSDTYSEYLMYLIREHNMENAEVYKRAIVDKKIFSKIKNNVNYHPNKLTALCLCIGAKLNLDETKDLLARAGYALSPCDKTDIIFSYFIENEIYDMIELDIQLEEHGLPCIIS